ncbi:helix-turn-helix transcriptional regulator [Pseudomonas nicosulfuronedens]|uniref:Helix-turn-helix transcriptional regulator n=1 Tax=Pseudomonas nicosulfuronedens TaxID=2571105 RepID=A0A5R9R7Q8_9PSED|nr:MULTISPECIES: helix-turn-helix transcriptional regulator [Pseudomonas]TLX69721.1 helix-turn-helix transcriptional regulator [Pseudomonas nicosulfuronedens]
MKPLQIQYFNHSVLATRLAKEVQSRAVTLDELSAATHIPSDSLNDFITGTQCPTLHQLATIASVVGLSPAWLAFGQGEAELPSVASARGEYASDLRLSPDELKAKYSFEHPLFNQATWINQVAAGIYLEGYWAWTAEQLRELNSPE